MLSLMLLSSIILASCGYSGDAATIYVLTPPDRASRFTEDLAAIAQRHGLAPNPGRATDDKGHEVYVLEAKNTWVRLWGENVPLSGREDPARCGEYDEPHSDPGQYVVTLDRRFPLIAKKEPRRLIDAIGNELKASGYDIRHSPEVCSSLSKVAPSRAN
jgi:hypothetical protein